MSFNDKIKQAIDKVDPDRLIAEAKGSAGELAREHRGRLEQALDKIESTVDGRTKGKYADKLARAHRSVTDGVAKVAAQPPVEPESPTDGRPDYRRRPSGELPQDPDPQDGPAPSGDQPS